MPRLDELIIGRAWKFNDDVDTDAIIPGKYLVLNSSEELAKHAFENVRPNFAQQVVVGDIIVAGENFGCGSSREHAPLALKGTIGVVIAQSFARIFFRNAVNIGLPVLECETINVNDGDLLQIDFEGATVHNETTNETYMATPFPPFIRGIIEAGGLVNYIKQHI